MFDMSLGEMLVIAVLVLVFFDADQLPELMKKAGRIYGQVRSASDDLRRAFNTEVARVDADKRRAELERRREELRRLRPVTPPAESEGADPAVARPDRAAEARAARANAQPASGEPARVAPADVPMDHDALFPPEAPPIVPTPVPGDATAPPPPEGPA